MIDLLENITEEQLSKIIEEEIQKTLILMEKCWKGYEKKGMKKMFGKMYPNCVKKKKKRKSKKNEEANPRIPRKKGQPAKSDKHSDLYTDEDPKGTIKGLQFKNKRAAALSVAKIKRSGRSHAHKTQAAIAMEQRAKVAKKSEAAAVYRKFIEEQKRKTKAKNS